jgi:hypothetical protein
MKSLLAYIVLAIVVIGSGCVGTMSESLTPARIDPKVVKYNTEAGVGDANDYRGFLFPSLATLRKLQNHFEAAVVLTNQELKHLIEQKQLQADILRGTLKNDVDVAVAREDFIFNPTTGVLALGLSLAGIGAGGYLGLMRKRPQDITPVEMEKALVGVKGELDGRDRRIIDIVNSVKNVIEAQPTQAAQDSMTAMLKSAQLPETRQVVKEVLAKL